MMRHNKFKFHPAAHWVPHTPADTFVRSLQQMNREDSISQRNIHQKNLKPKKKSTVRLYINNTHITWVNLKKKMSGENPILALSATMGISCCWSYTQAVMTHTWNSAHFHFSHVSGLAHEIEIFPPAPALRPSNTTTFSQRIHNII